MGRVVRWVVAVSALVVLAGCSNPPERVPVAQPTVVVPVEPTEEVVVATPPSVTPTSVATLSDDDPASITTLQAGDVVEDRAGNLIAVHALATVPRDLPGIEAFDLFDNTELELGAGPVGVIDLSWCAPGEHLPTAGTTWSFAVIDQANAPLAVATAPVFRHALVEPGFVPPAPGACHRGWVPVRLGASDATIVRYVSTESTDAAARHVYHWDLERHLVRPSTVGATAPHRLGQTVRFNDGPLVDTTVVLKGWAELFDAAPPQPGLRQVGVLVEVCPATEDWPELGLAVNGWNVLGPLDPADRLGADPLAPLTGSCFEDWAEFGVPIGVEPSGFFVSDGIDPVTGFAAWTLEGAAVAPPG